MIKMFADSGKSGTKYGCFQFEEPVLDFFPTTARLKSGPLKKGEKWLTFGPKTWIVGEEEMSPSPNATVTDKVTETHHLCALAAVCEVMKRVGKAKEVVCTLNLPLPQYLDEQAREDAQLLYDGDYQLFYDGGTYDFRLKVVPYFEGFGLHALYEGSGEVLAVDLGSWNTNAITFAENGNPSRKRSACLTLGMERLYRQVAESCRPYVSEELTPVEAKKLIGKNELWWETVDIRKAVDQTVMGFLESLRAELLNRGIGVERCQVVFGGGGAQLLFGYVGSVFPGSEVLEEAVYANAVGSLVALE